MKWFSELPAIYLHREYVDFRKAVNGLCLIVEQELSLNPYDASLYVFCNRSPARLRQQRATIHTVCKLDSR